MKLFVKRLSIFVLTFGIVVLALRLVFPLPDISNRPENRAIAFNPDTLLGAHMASGMASHPKGLSGILPLGKGDDALASRLALIQAAEVSIDSQYYIWHNDVSGILLLDALDRAAHRGVRVRLLLDDNGVPGLDPIMATLNAHENFEIRLFNPSTVRSPKTLGYAFDFFRMNRRMHNKSMTADSAVAIVGGRNIGDEYFRVGEDVFYIDMDAIATGSVINDTTKIFDDYWNSQSVFELERLVKTAPDRAGFAARVNLVKSSTETQEVADESQNSFKRFLSGSIIPEWTHVEVIADDPTKGAGQASGDQLLMTKLSAILKTTKKSLDLVSAYFIPGTPGTAVFTELEENGRQVRILTNALNTTDVSMVHAGYSRYRRALLESGVDLFELKLRGGIEDETAPPTPTPTPRFLLGASLHAKAFSIDKEKIFIGSFNFDPRSALLNCEMGFLIDSPEMATRMSRNFDGPIRIISYQPRLTPEDKMIWQEELPSGETTIYQEEPGASWAQQIFFAIVGILPVEWML